ncbi:3-dehydroquinate synthase [Bradyrhizobium sp. CCGUVB4N]|uniref:3-dehydroquinate synthase n=1 Tax=Bradyrhizobium sp. CCGUVB4N TaxID=2949631 RepID=UPI0020B1886B|nr:3-dehydroquinate synthase family protein [Bradyrhizobium sp. CCGUVB4N]MCP3384587.1 3-dehydroquinate synthase [Bradyrhizobium sp. CCGUVB4N]
MQESFEIAASTGSYPVTVGQNLFSQIVTENPDAIYIIDKILEPRLPANIKKRIVIEALESNKSLEFAPHVIGELRKLGADRTSHLFAIGGGIIQDITTFAASIYMRGVDWTYLPTTLLSMVDSCIGGKSSINAAGYKNLVGNFFPPNNVVVDVSFIDTLDAEMIVGGLYEAGKICYASGYQGFLDYLAQEPARAMTAERAQRVILKSLRTKKWFIEVDEFDRKERLLLNFGHTFGHAIEAATEFAVSHGIGVGLGMLVANEYAKRHGNLTSDGQKRADHLASHVRALLGNGASSCLPRGMPTIDLALVMDKFDYDKKHRPGFYRTIVPTGDGALELISVPKTDETRRNIVAAYEAALGDIPWPFAKFERAALAS